MSRRHEAAQRQARGVAARDYADFSRRQVSLAGKRH